MADGNIRQPQSAAAANVANVEARALAAAEQDNRSAYRSYTGVALWVLAVLALLTAQYLARAFLVHIYT